MKQNKSRRGALKTIGKSLAGITGVAAVATETVAAKDHTIKIVARSGRSSYRIVVPDRNCTVGNFEGGAFRPDNINRRSSSAVVTGTVRADFSPRNDKIFYNGSGSLPRDNFSISGGGLAAVYLNGHNFLSG